MNNPCDNVYDNTYPGYVNKDIIINSEFDNYASYYENYFKKFHYYSIDELKQLSLLDDRKIVDENSHLEDLVGIDSDNNSGDGSVNDNTDDNYIDFNDDDIKSYHESVLHYENTPQLNSINSPADRIKILEEENTLLRRAASNSVRSNKMDEFYKKFTENTTLDKKRMILQFSKKTDIVLSIEDINTLSDDEIDKLYIATKETQKKISKLDLSASIIKIILAGIEYLISNVLKVTWIKGITASIDQDIIEENFRYSQNYINDKLSSLPELPFLDIILFLIKNFISNKFSVSLF